MRLAAILVGVAVLLSGCAHMYGAVDGQVYDAGKPRVSH